MRAAVLHSFGADFSLEDRTLRAPGPGEVEVEVVSCGAGLTLEHIRRGAMGGTPPFVMGHEYAGQVARLGAGVTYFQQGDPVTGTFYLTCGQCDMCASGHETLCRHFAGWIGAAIDGAFAQRVIIPARNLVPIPEGVPLRDAGIVADAIATPLHVAQDRLHIVAGDRVVVLGAGGGLGVHMLEVVRAFGAVAIAVERDPAKLQALEQGRHADLLLDASDPHWQAELRRAAGGPLRGVVDTVGTSETLAAGAALLDARSALVILGFTEGAELKASPIDLLMKEAAILGTRYCNRAEIAASLELVRQGRVRTVIGARYPLDQINRAFEAIRANAVFGRVIVDVAEP